MNIVEKALKSNSQLTFNELSKLANYSEEEQKWAKIFWSSSFNDGWMYVSKEMLVEWFGQHHL